MGVAAFLLQDLERKGLLSRDRSTGKIYFSREDYKRRGYDEVDPNREICANVILRFAEERRCREAALRAIGNPARILAEE